MRRLLDPAHAPFAVGLAAVALLGGALVSQYGFGLRPCDLCLWQRWPHAIVAGLALLALLVPRGAGLAALTALMGLVMLAGAGIAGFHVGVEAQWWTSPTDCAAPDIQGGDVSAMVDTLMATDVVRCDEVPFRLLGLSMAGWNMVASLGLAGLAGIAALRLAGGAHRQPHTA